MNTTDVENFPGFRDGIMGPALMDEMRAQAERFGAELVADDVVEVDLTGDVKVVRTATDTFHARAVILAMGSGYRKLGLPREEELSGRGVSWCATCDGFFFRDQHIAVVGGGDSAIEEATFLTRFGSKVSLIVRRDELRASKIMQERAFADPKLEILWNSKVKEINGADRLESLTLEDTVTGETRELPATGLFIAAPTINRMLVRSGRSARSGPVAMVLMFGFAVYGGYFGAGLGQIMLAALVIAGWTDLHQANALKNASIAAISLASVVLMALSGYVHWPSALLMMVGSSLGGYVGGRVSRLVPARALRYAVIAFGVFLTVRFFWMGA